MTDYTQQIQQIQKATSLEEIKEVARQFSAKATGEGGVLYSRPVGEVSSEVIAKELASKTSEPIINNTPRAKFLGDLSVESAIRDAAERIFSKQGMNLTEASKAVPDFLYGNPKAVAQSATSLEGSLWGEASKEFASSLRGDIKVVATNANVERVFGKVELPAMLENPNVRSLGGQPVAELKTLYAQGGADAVLPKVQAQFIEAAPKGIYGVPETPGAKVTSLAISREAAATLGVDATKFSTAAELAAAGQRPAPTGFTAPVAATGEAALTGEAAAAARGGLRPGMVMKGAAVAGVAVLAYDFVSTGHQVVKLEAQGNVTGSESAKTHFIGRNVGGIGGGIAGGFLTGAGYGLVAGSETGPGALVTGLVGGIGGGIVGGFMGEKWAQQKDIERVFTQKDKDGNEWSRDPNDLNGAWTRVAETQRVQNGSNSSTASPVFSNVRYVAGDGLANELNYKSANASYDLGLANVSKPQDPYSIPPNATDTHSLSGGSNWTRNSETQSWTRYVADQRIERGPPIGHTEIADPKRAAELDQASKVIIAQNASNTPAAIAARYEIAYNQFGWSRNGEMPASIIDAKTKTGTLMASDGSTYTRNASGAWETPGTLYGTNQATGNIRRELDAVYESQRVGLIEMSSIAAEAKANPTLPSANPMRSLIASTYASAGIARTDAQIDAATAAVTATHTREGLDKAGKPYSLSLQPDPATGRAGPNSGIVTMMDNGDDSIFSNSKIVPRATTTIEQIRDAEKTISAPQATVTPTSTTLNTPAQAAPNTNDITQPTHLGHQRYQQALRAIENSSNIPPNTFTGDRLQQSAANLAYASLAGEQRQGKDAQNETLSRIDYVVFNKDRSGLIAGEGALGKPDALRAWLSSTQDNASSLTASSERMHTLLQDPQKLALANPSLQPSVAQSIDEPQQGGPRR
jgi:hypothetical protein